MATGVRRATLRINDQDVPVAPRETVLQAAERAGIAFPHSCRVGGCGTCRCRVVRGRVRELTETGYLLSAEEIDSGYVLACQSVPQTDVRIDVDLDRHRGTPGTVIAQDRVTHDITRLTVQLTRPLAYKAGQFANLAIEGLPQVVRSYSFATPAQPDGRVAFLVRNVPGGQFSGLLHKHSVVGRKMFVDGPAGEFFLRAGRAPLLLVAGGSGLSPLLAMLEEALASGVDRPVTLLFGARARRDLYALTEIDEIARQWRGPFRFVPVLSAEEPDDAWRGARGLVTEHIAGLLPPGAHAYLCGPPAMIDSAIACLHARGVPQRHIHCDRFTTRADAATMTPDAASGNAPAQAAGLLHYVKYFGFHGIGLLALASMFLGGQVASVGLLAILGLYMLGDALLGDDTSTPSFRWPAVLTGQLWLALPLLVAIVFASVWTVSPGDPLGVGALIEQRLGVPVFAERAATTLGQHVAIFVLTGLMIGMIGTITAHELTHRTWDPVSMVIGRWLLAFSFDTNFAIEHVYGHHRYVSTALDPATAPRGRNVYHHIVASTFKGNLSAWRIEVDRLRKKRLGVWSFHNTVLRGQLMSFALLAAAYGMGGWIAAGYFALCGLWGKSLLEIVNYMEHYGMVRDPATPVQPRHSWNTNRRISSWTMFNLTRHSHHHAQGEVPYQDLKPFPDAPMMVNGYLTTIVVAMIPPLWHRLMAPKVLAWDRDYASPDERALAARANARSGLPALMRRATAGSPARGDQTGLHRPTLAE